LKAIYAWSVVHGWAMLLLDGSTLNAMSKTTLKHDEIQKFILDVTAHALSSMGSPPKVE
jgi:hypothetical protein